MSSGTGPLKASSTLPQGLRGSRVWALPVVAGMLLGLAACSSTPKYSGAEGAQSPDRPRQGSSQVLRSQYDEEEDTYANAAMAPLEDLNIKRKQIPEVLVRASDRPYDLTGMETCAAIAGEVRKLDAVLGRDYDEAPPPEIDQTLRERGQDAADDYMKGAVRGAARDLIPFRGVWRHLTGAEAHQKQVERAIQAGKARRAYLKGVGMNKNCAPPAAPSWFKPRVYVETVQPVPEGPRSNAPKPNPPAKKTTTPAKKKTTTGRAGR